ncbi:putative polyketide hydroxylase [Amycolatopsis arida]|uniref:Putative polyketide hydroxylase n=1 Tax=Amycolatopsis arida TaxID=587909 RepID=A0A1I6A958_9PSEU|nr:FAD-dependent oxidoreductase [Amycolatopsis arida]TDX88506.1 putative polyketide hydroxylase [Amycolatopsis arida]SFQ65195.1 putative polyketide hydroxylase [Amycolatopsis arida]
MDDARTSVLVVGGGIVGLTAAAFLARHGVPVTLVERHPGTSVHPRAWGWYPRTMELWRELGIEDAVLAEAAGFADHNLIAKVTSLSGEVLHSTVSPAGEDLGHLSPSPQISLSQDRLEPIVRAAAADEGADLRFSTELVDLAEVEDGARAVLLDRTSGTTTTLTADYVVAADGARSPLRARLAVGVVGREALRHQLSILFNADLATVLGGRRFAICQIENPEVSGVLGHDDTLGQATLIVTYHPDRGETPADYDHERCARLATAALGTTDVPVTIRSVLPWEMGATVAERYRAGRVFFVGDAAHVIPPVGGYGANTGVQDAHNLAWKLAAVLSDQAGPALLDTYEHERRPVAQGVVEQATMRLAVRAGYATPEQKAALLETTHVTLGYRYPVDDSPAPLFADPADLVAEPGVRLPHLWVGERSGERSTVDLVDGAWTVVAGPGGTAWAGAARAAATRLNLPVHAHVLDGVAGPADVDGRWEKATGLGPEGAILSRPDGFVSARWDRGLDGNGDHLATVLRTALARE